MRLAVPTTNPFRQLLTKGKDLPIWERIHLLVLEESSPFGIISFVAVHVASVWCTKKLSFNDDNHILKFFTEGVENLLSSFFFNSENLLSSIEQCTCLHLYFLFRKFHLDIHNKMADNDATALPHETDFDISKDCFC